MNVQPLMGSQSHSTFRKLCPIPTEWTVVCRVHVPCEASGFDDGGSLGRDF